MLKLINGKWVYEDPPKHPKCIKRIEEHLEFLSKCCIVESIEFGASFYCETQSPYWNYTNLITD